MIKKAGFITLLLIILASALQLSGYRDFSQFSLAGKKYQQSNNLDVLVEDILRVIQGKRVREGNRLLGQYADQVIYRWKDELGQMHVSERRPDVAEFEIIRLGDLKFKLQEGMSEEEIKQAFLLQLQQD